MPVAAVIFDWGGTLTPWHDVDLQSKWYAYAEIYDPVHAGELAVRLHAAEDYRHRLQRESDGAEGCGTLDSMFIELGIDIHGAQHAMALNAYLDGWTPHTFADPAAFDLLTALRADGIRVGVLSNTMWPRWHHESVLSRDGLLDLIDAAVYTSEIPVGKPHPHAYRAILDELGDIDPADAVYVGDRLWEDVHGPKAFGMRAIWLPNSAIPFDQLVATQVAPDATIAELGEVLAVVRTFGR